VASPKKHIFFPTLRFYLGVGGVGAKRPFSLACHSDGRSRTWIVCRHGGMLKTRLVFWQSTNCRRNFPTTFRRADVAGPFHLWYIWMKLLCFMFAGSWSSERSLAYSDYALPKISSFGRSAARKPAVHPFRFNAKTAVGAYFQTHVGLHPRSTCMMSTTT